MPANKKSAALRLGKHGTGLTQEEIDLELKPIPGRPETPKHFDKVHIAEWNRFCDIFESLNILSVTDVHSIAMITETSVELRKARKDLAGRGSSFYEKVSASGTRSYQFYPEYFIVRELTKELKGLLVDFGLTPRARASVAVSPVRGEDDDIYAQYGS
jgi:P27 family predicted phage terminase small subunit